MDNSCSVNLDKWRNYFNVHNCNIFDIINHAIMVAMADCPIDFKQKRDQIAELLFNCTNIKCSRCGKVEFPPSFVENIDGKLKSGVEIGGTSDRNKRKVNDNADQGLLVTDNMNVNQGEETEELTGIIDEEKRLCDEVLRIKEILDNGEEEADIVIYELVRSLRRMGLTYRILEETGIVKTVNALRNHGSTDVRNRVRDLINDWKAVVDRESYQTKEAIADAAVTKETKRASGFVEEYHGLPAPPMDDIYLNNLTIDPTICDYLEFLTGKDDLGNLPKNVEFNKNKVKVSKTRLVNPNIQIRKPDSNKDSSTCPRNKLNPNLKRTSKENMPRSHEAYPTRPTPVVQPKHPVPSRSKLIAQQKPSKRESALGRSKPSEARPIPILQTNPTRRECIPSGPKPVVRPQYSRHECSLKPNISNGIRVQRKTDQGVIQKKFIKASHDVTSSRKKDLEGTTMRDILETAKRKRQERYHEVNNAKKQRIVKVMEFKDLNKERNDDR